MVAGGFGSSGGQGDVQAWGGDDEEEDWARADEAQERASAAPIGSTITWNNPDTGSSGSVTPRRDGTAANGEYCREFDQRVNINGRSETSYGVACRNNAGVWRVVD